jgi:SAM-dependent methyltransferase
MTGLLDVLIRATRAVRVLEIGTGTGVSALEMAAALPADGRLITVEKDAAAAMQARTALASAGFDRRVTVMIGDAARYLHKIAGPFDLIVQDSDPAAYASMHDRLVSVLRPAGTLITRRISRTGDYNGVLAADTRLATAFLHTDEAWSLDGLRSSQMRQLFSVETTAPPEPGAPATRLLRGGVGEPGAPATRLLRGGVGEAGQNEILASEAAPPLHTRWSEAPPRVAISVKRLDLT